MAAAILAPATWLLICTVTAGLQKLFSPDPALGFLAQSAKYSAALAEGRVLAPAKSVGDMHKIITNGRIDAALCGFFILVSVAITLLAVRAALIAYRDKAWSAREHAGPAPAEAG